MNQNSNTSLLVTIAKHFKSAEAKFENGVLYLRASYCPNVENFVEGWRKTMYSENTIRILTEGAAMKGATS